MMPAPFKDAPLRGTEQHQAANFIPAEAGVRPEACEVDGIGRNIVAGEQLLLPGVRIIVEANGTV